MLYPSWGGGAQLFEMVGLNTALSTGTDITASATPGNDGAWTQLIASTAGQYHAIQILLAPGDNGISGNALVQIAVGAASGEQPLLTLHASNRGANDRGPFWNPYIPLSIPGGSRIAARVHRSATASASYKISLIGFRGPTRYLPPFHRLTAYGIDLANARGTSVDPGGTANTQGAKATIVASTTNPIKALYILCTKRDEAVVAANFRSTIQIFLGASGPALTPEIPVWAINSTADVPAPAGLLGPFFVNLPAGVDLRAAARSSGITAGERESQVILWGLD